MIASPWLTDPALSGRFHPQQPNDLQVVVHDGEPRRTKLAPEAAWVTVTGVHGILRMPVASEATKMPLDPSQVSWSERAVYTATLLNEPRQLVTVRRGESLLFLHSPGIPHPVRVTEQYIAERSRWAVIACQGCGADQSLDPPSIMARTRFPDAPAGATPVAFTAICPCGGTMTLCMVKNAAQAQKQATARVEKKPWWKLW
jgi:hypothetical protein